MTEDDLDVEERKRRLVAEDLQALLSTPVGRRVLWRIIEGSGLWSPSFSSDAALAAYAEGRRSIGIGLMELIQAESPNRWSEMVQEALNPVR